jgi:hypothetical protein
VWNKDGSKEKCIKIDGKAKMQDTEYHNVSTVVSVNHFCFSKVLLCVVNLVVSGERSAQEQHNIDFDKKVWYQCSPPVFQWCSVL